MTARNKQTEPENGQQIETTGHEWDGIEEFNNPLPRWWLWTFYATILWALVYMVAFPSWPLLKQATPGVLGYSSRSALEADVTRFRIANAPLDAALISADLTAIAASPELAQYASSGGAALFRTYCAQCHGSGGAGAKGYPNLLDDDWLWGGTITDIYQTISHGIRDGSDPDTHDSQMLAFGELLETDEIADVRHFVLSLSNAQHNPALVSSGSRVFAENCADCHGETGTGNRELGAPNLADAIWLYGSDQLGVLETITNGRNGMMPAWQARLTDSQLRQVAFYVHQLGGGE